VVTARGWSSCESTPPPTSRAITGSSCGTIISPLTPAAKSRLGK
jgi:hypothetical protein